LSGSSFHTESSPYWFSQAVLPSIITSVPSKIYSLVEILNSIYGTATYGTARYGLGETLVASEIQDYLPQGLENLFYNGSKVTSPGFDIDSPDTVDGGPVVEIIDANPNQIVFQAPSNAVGNFKVT
jgi:hypothetical protein